MKNIKVAVIGCGIIGDAHIKQYTELPGCEIAALCDIDPARLELIADRYNVKARYTHIGKMLREVDCDAVDICLHNNQHRPATIAVLESGRHAYCEKPMAGTYADSLAMLEAAKRTGKMLHIQLALLYDNATKAAKIFIDNGRLGRLYHMRSVGFRRRGRPFVDGYATKEFVNSKTARGGALFDMGVYRMSQLIYLAGVPKLERVVGRTYREVAVDPARQKESGFDVEELGVGLAHYEGGLTMDIIESWAIHLGGLGSTCIAGTEGGIAFDPFHYHNLTDDMQLDATVDLGQLKYRNETVHAAGNLYESSQAHWLHAIRGEVGLIPTAEIALQTMLAQEGVFLSSKLGREVTADEIRKSSVSTSLELPNLAL